MEVAEYERLLDEALYYISEKDMICSAAVYTAMKEKFLTRRKNDMIRRAMAGNRS